MARPYDAHLVLRKSPPAKTVYGYRPPEEEVPWFGEGGTIPTVLGEIGSDA